MKCPLDIRTVADLDRTARSLALHFKTRTVVVVGSQGILVGWPGAPVTMCMSPEIDAYPANARAWEAAQDDDLAEASEEISVFFGEGSLFHTAHGFYIDGVDDRTARLPPSWPSRAVVREVSGHGTATVTVVAPGPEDLIVSKLARLADKDRDYIAAYHRARPLDLAVIEARMAECGLEELPARRALAFLAGLPTPRESTPAGPVRTAAAVPSHPAETHCAFLMDEGRSVSVRAWNEAAGLYEVLDNPLGPAVVAQDGTSAFLIDGKALPREVWDTHPRVRAARRGDLSGYPRPNWAPPD